MHLQFALTSRLASVFMMPREHAVRLPNRTYPVPEYANEGLYFGQLDVFHQLHCLVSYAVRASVERILFDAFSELSAHEPQPRALQARHPGGPS